MALLLTSVGKSLLQTQRCNLYRMSSTAKAFKGMDEYWKKNRRLGRPLSPHLSVYKFEPNMAASITHRISGCYMVGVLWLGPMLYMCGSQDLATYLGMVKDWGAIGTCIAITAKAAIAYPVTYHTLNGVRHLLWDWALMFNMKTILQTGILTACVALAIGTCLMFQ